MRNEKNLGYTAPYNKGMVSYSSYMGIYYHKPWNKDPYELMNQPSISMESIQLMFFDPGSNIGKTTTEPTWRALKIRWFPPKSRLVDVLGNADVKRLLSMWPSYGYLVIYLENIGIT